MIIVITGASSGIGLETAKFLAKKGHTVYGLSRRGTSEGFIGKVCDITNFEQVKSVFEEIKQETGRIDVLINNAGMGISGAIEYTDAKDVQKIFDVNFFGLVNACKLIVPIMREQGFGKIVNISSVASDAPIPFQAFYSASKSAVKTFSYALRIEVKEFNIDVSVVFPGDTKTGFTSAREKVEKQEAYGNRVSNSVKKMEKDEQKGMPAVSVSKIIYKIIRKKRSPACKTVGFGYKMLMFLIKVVPTGFMLWIVKKLYG